MWWDYIYQHMKKENTFAIYKTKPETTFFKDTSLDLVLCRFMLGYLGETILSRGELTYYDNEILQKAQRLIIFDYIGKNHFMLYATQ